MAQQCRLVMPYEDRVLQHGARSTQDEILKTIEHHASVQSLQLLLFLAAWALDHAVFMELEMDCIFVDGGGC